MRPRSSQARALRLAASFAVVVALAAGGIVATAGPVRALGVLPVAVNDTLSMSHDRTATVAAPGVLGNDVLVGGPFTAVFDNGGSNQGTIDLSSDGGYTYTPKAGFIGTAQFRYYVDGGLLGNSNVARVNITVTNAKPVGVADSYTAVAGTPRVVAAKGVLANDTDADGDSLTATLTTPVSHGSLSLSSNGGFTYTAAASYAGTDTFRYRAEDGIVTSGAITVTLTVTGAAPTPTPSPTPTPTPIPTPTPTPTPTPRPTPTPILPTLPPLPTILPTLPPLPTSLPLPTLGPSPRPTASTVATASPTASPTPGASGVIATPDPGASSGPTPSSSPTDPLPGVAGGGTGGGTTGGTGTSPGGGTRPLSVPDLALNAPLAVSGMPLTSFGLFEWLVPGFALTGPGLLLMLIVLAQVIGGGTFMPLTRRLLGGFGLAKRRRREARQTA